MVFKKIKWILPLIVNCIFLQSANGQSEEEETALAQFELRFIKEDPEWIPNLLIASVTPVINMAQFNGFALNWVPKGMPNTKGVNLGGLFWKSNLAGWDPGFTYSGLYRSFKSIAMVEHYAISNAGYGGQGTTSYLVPNADLFKKGQVFFIKISNAATLQEFNYQFSSGQLKKNLYINAQIVSQYTPLGQLANGSKKRNGFLLSIDKQLKNKQSIGLSFWWMKAAQGKRTPAVNEVFELRKDEQWNPSWGMLAGIPLYPNQKLSNIPIAQFRYQKNWSDETHLTINLGFAKGNQSSTQLDWSQSADPRPDYYKYLPSYIKDSVNKARLVDYYENTPAALLYNFEAIFKINQSHPDKRAFYIINERKIHNRLIKGSAHYQSRINDFWAWQGGFNFSNDKMTYRNVVADLLGGRYYLNFNSWANEEAFIENTEFDLKNPGRKVAKGDAWGAHYSLSNLEANTWMQLTQQAPKSQWGIAYQLEWNQFYRIGYNQDGRFPALSYGQSATTNFYTVGVKTEYIYKFSGRMYLKSVVYLQQDAPTSTSIYLDASSHAYKAAFIGTNKNQGTTIAFFYRAPTVKLYWNYFFQNSFSLTQKKMFYHDYFNAFVHGNLGNLNKQYMGIEFSVETNWPGPFQITATSNFSNNYIRNNPTYELRLVNDLYKIASGSLYLKGLPASEHPQEVHALSCLFQPTYSFRIGLTGVYGKKRTIHYDYFRRNSILFQQIGPGVLWDQIRAPVWLANELLLNGFLSRQFRIKTSKNPLLLSIHLAVKNMLSQSIPSLVFEQARFDYKEISVSKFPLKYIYDLGTTYTMGIQINY